MNDSHKKLCQIEALGCSVNTDQTVPEEAM